MIYLLPALGVALIATIGIVLSWRPEAVQPHINRLWDSRAITGTRQRFVTLRAQLIDGFGAGWAFVLILSAWIPPIVITCVAAGMLATHPLWSQNVSLYGWFAHEGATAPSLLDFLNAFSTLGKWRATVLVGGVAGLGLVIVSKDRRWLGPVLIAVAIVCCREIQLTIGYFVHQVHPPTTVANFPSGGVARVIGIYGFIAYLYLRLRSRPRWTTTVLVWTFIALLGFMMGFARAALLLHWPFDIPGGWLFGTLILFMMISASTVFVGSYFPSRTARVE